LNSVGRDSVEIISIVSGITCSLLLPSEGVSGSGGGPGSGGVDVELVPITLRLIRVPSVRAYEKNGNTQSKISVSEIVL
jgi:hypothetical protein